MGTKSKAGTFTANSGTGEQVVTGVGFTPKIVMLWMTNRTGVGGGADAYQARGWSDGSNEGSAASAWKDGANPSVTQARVVETKVISLVDTDGTILAEADLTSLNPDGFTINWTTAGGSRLIGYLALGGTSITDVKVGGLIYNQSDDIAVTGVGFQPDVVMFYGVGAVTSFGSTSRGGFAEGIAKSNSKRQSSSHRWRNNQAPNTGTGASGYTIDQCLVPSDDSTTPERRIDLVSMDADGFTLTNDAINNDVTMTWLAIKGIDVDFGISLHTQIEISVSVEGLSFKPSSVIFSGGQHDANNGWADTVGCVAGAASSPSEMFAIWTGGDSAVNSVADSAMETDACYQSRTPGTPTIETEAFFKTFNSDGFTIEWTIANGPANKYSWIAFGPFEDVQKEFSLPFF